jgi:hypothetical protein
MGENFLRKTLTYTPGPAVLFYLFLKAMKIFDGQTQKYFKKIAITMTV